MIEVLASLQQRLTLAFLFFVITTVLSGAVAFGIFSNNSHGVYVVDELEANKREVLTQETTEEEPKVLALVAVSPVNAETPSVVNSRDFGYYRVESGDSLYWIAETYDTTPASLRELNGLVGDTIKPGQVLRVPMHTLREYPVGIALTDKEVIWLAQMIHAEARGEPYLGQVAVGAVIINRMKSRQFPNTLRGVLFQPRAFQPIQNGSFFLQPNDSAHRAAREALAGADPSNGALFFFNPNQSRDRFMHARPAVVTIGQHRFMY